MEPFNVYILGCGSAKPSRRHNASAQVVELRGKLMMIDCGEGSQVQLSRSHISFQRLLCVFISHLHGDHCLGLVGMISSFALLGRTMPLQIYAPSAFEKLLADMLCMFCPDPGFEIVFHGVDTTKHTIIYEDRSITVETIPLAHRVPCCGYLFREKPTLPHIRRDMIDFYKIPVSQINNIKMGMDWTTPEGEVIDNSRLVTPPDKVRSYAYCSDTRYIPTLHHLLHGVNLLYHESTYGDDAQESAAKYGHSTAREAAQVARDAQVGQLLLGHYSARYDNEETLLEQAREVFENSELSQEGLVFMVK